MSEQEPPQNQGIPLPNGWTLPSREAWSAAANAFADATDDAGVDPSEHRCLEFCPICRAADVLRAAGPPELRGQLDDVSREALLTLRALIDHYLERVDAQPTGADRVEEIPID